MVHIGLFFAFLGLAPALALRRASPSEQARLNGGATSAKATAASNASQLTMNNVGDNIKRALEGHFNCEAYPGMCKAPFNCHKYSVLKLFRHLRSGVGYTGHADPSGLCHMPDFEPFFSTCLVEKDIVKAAKLHYEQITSGHFGQGRDLVDTDASFCFLEGYCKDQDVTSTTTSEEAERLCDRKYGHDEWSRFMSFKSLVAEKREGAPHPGEGFSSRNQSRPLAMQACALGHYHCSVMYCKETLCKDDNLIRKYGHLAE